MPVRARHRQDGCSVSRARLGPWRPLGQATWTAGTRSSSDGAVQQSALAECCAHAPGRGPADCEPPLASCGSCASCDTSLPMVSERAQGSRGGAARRRRSPQKRASTQTVLTGRRTCLSHASGSGFDEDEIDEALSPLSLLSRREGQYTFDLPLRKLTPRGGSHSLAS